VPGLALALLVLAAPARSQDGRAVFKQRCASCHSVAEGAAPMAGPNLHGVLGRRVAGDSGFDYSPALERAGERGEVWDAARLTHFLDDPDEAYPGSWMGANGLREEAERRAVVTFLQGAR
jgi:cytochrome c